MDARKVVVQEIQRVRGDVVFEFLGKAVREACKAAHLHTHGEVLALDVGRGNVGSGQV